METIGVDLGNCNIKTSKGVIVPSLITKGENYLISTGYQIAFNNEVFIIGEGNYDTNLDKISKENLLPMLCLALGLSTKEEFIRMVIGLPINQYRTKKDKMIEVIENNKILNFKLNGEERTIYIEDAAIFPEGVATYYSLDVDKRKALIDKDLIVLDIGGKYKNYCSDMTRTVFIGKEPSKEHAEVYNIVKSANEKAISIIKEGVKFSDIDKAARNLITDAGYGDYFTHRTGHSIGIECHDFGNVSSVNDDEVKAGMIFSVEPGIYLKDNIGVRIEDLVLVTKDGCEVLNSVTKEITVL